MFVNYPAIQGAGAVLNNNLYYILHFNIIYHRKIYIRYYNFADKETLDNVM